MNYYNEHDPNAAAWLEELIAGGDLPPGFVDSRDVQDIGLTEPLDCYNQCHFFAGIGGWSHALDLAGWPRDRAIWSASLPCQPFSDAGKSLGVDDERHLWPTFHRLVERYRPEFVVGEQVASKAGRAWFAAVRSEMEALGYECGATDICAAGVGAPHIRQRLYWCAVRVGHTERIPAGRNPGTGDEAEGEAQLRAERDDAGSSSNAGGLADAASIRQHERDTRAGGNGKGDGRQSDTGEKWRSTEKPTGSSEVGGMADGNGAGLEVLREQPARQELASAERGCADSWGRVVYVPCADGKARPLPRIAKSCLEPLVNGFSDCLASVLSFQSQIWKEIVDYAGRTKTNPDQVMRILRETVQPQEAFQRQAGGLRSFHASSLLLHLLLGAEAARDRPADYRCGKKEGIKVIDRAMLSLRLDGGAFDAPCGRRSDEQCSIKPPETVQALSQLLAQHAETYREKVLAAHAANNRVGMLRGYGNSIVAPLAAEFISAFMEILEEKKILPNSVDTPVLTR